MSDGEIVSMKMARRIVRAHVLFYYFFAIVRFHADDLVIFHLHFLRLHLCTKYILIWLGSGGCGRGRGEDGSSVSDTWQLFNVYAK